MIGLSSIFRAEFLSARFNVLTSRLRIFILSHFIFLIVSLSTGAATLTSVEPQFNEEEFVLFLQVSQSTPYRVWRTVSPPKVIVDIGAALPEGAPSSISLDDRTYDQVRLDSGPMGARVVLDARYAVPPPAVSWEDDRLVLTLPRSFRSIDETYVAPGIRYGTVRAGKVYGPVSMKYLKVNLRHPGVTLQVALGDEEFRLADVQQIASRAGAVAGVNGGYFHWSGQPLGLVIQDGELVSDHLYGRTAFLLTDDGIPLIERAEVHMWFERSDGVMIPVDGINRPFERGQVVVYTPQWGTLPPRQGERFAWNDGFLTAAGEDWEANNSLMIEFDPRREDAAWLKPGEYVRFRYRVAGLDEDEIVQAIGGGPRLVRGGIVEITGEEERFQPDVLLGRAPRTALGITDDNQLLLVVADGRNEQSVGLTLEELAHWMVELGAVEAMNLDGGASSTLVVRGMTLNRPAQEQPRPVASALLVYVRDDW